jgi:mutator protein MutT
MNAKLFRLAVRAVIHDEAGQCLLLRRSAINKGFGGYWEWPGGKADPGEDFDAALHREVREETGLEIEILRLAGAFEVRMPQSHIVTICMEARRTGGTLRLSDEHDNSAWVTLEQMSGLNLVAHHKETAAALAANQGAKGVGQA